MIASSKASAQLASHRTSVKAHASSAAGSKRLPVLILPGFLSNNTLAPSSQYSELRESLLALDHPAAEILPANTLDWVPTLSGEAHMNQAGCLGQRVGGVAPLRVCLLTVMPWRRCFALGCRRLLPVVLAAAGCSSERAAQQVRQSGLLGESLAVVAGVAGHVALHTAPRLSGGGGLCQLASLDRLRPVAAAYACSSGVFRAV